ncbi:MAG: hypothetical protein A3E83_06000 [Gammaproteobacteria bacterium RIFCSPHIGHO2_12_FULL_41_20]|nr:MAG: hypothetical protein A3E83_06000 [Gammaproteobacteria bacterium RIFCSPHIGHO2_12_FULL_41_20]
MNYRHVYHAGNFADVLKHVTLTGLILALLRKDTPFCYLDTHAGTGYYDLLSETAQKNQEHAQGILKLLQQDHAPVLIKRYLGCIRQVNNRLSQSRFASFRYYPGSPYIVRNFLRTKDRMILCELQPQDYQILKAAFNTDQQVAIHHADGFLGLKAFLPPREHRGLVLIDPPYENPNEWMRIASALPLALKRWETGIYAIWYPIKERRPIEQLHQHLRKTIKKPILLIELIIYPETIPNYLYGCGMLCINPPWQFQKEINAMLPWLWKILTTDRQGSYRCHLLK